MEIPEINMISDFEAGMKCLENPSSISTFLSFPGIFFKWGALIFAVLATFSSVIRRIKLIFIRFHTVKQPSAHHNEEINDFSDDDDDDVSLASSDDDEQEEEENAPTTSFRDSQRRVDENFTVKGSSSRTLWSEFTCGKSVVKLWDSLGLSLDFDEDLINHSSNGVVLSWETEYSDRVWNIPSAESKREENGVVLRGYDSRMRRRTPALYGEWSSPAEEIDGNTNGAVSKVYVRNDVSGVVTVGDVRNMRMPLGSRRESDGETWWDADAVIVENE